MKLRTIVLLIIGLIVAALIGANIFDFSKEDKFRTQIDKEKGRLKDEDYSLGFYSVDSVDKVKFISSINILRKAGIEYIQVKTEVYSTDSLIGTTEKLIETGSNYRDTAVFIKPQREVLIYICSVDAGANTDLKRQIFIVEEKNKQWAVRELPDDEINLNASVKETVGKLEKRK